MLQEPAADRLEVQLAEMLDPCVAQDMLDVASLGVHRCRSGPLVELVLEEVLERLTEGHVVRHRAPLSVVSSTTR